MEGLTFGQYIVVSRGVRKGTLNCRCACGVEKEVSVQHLRSGRSRSCGCVRKLHVLVPSQHVPYRAAWSAGGQRHVIDMTGTTVGFLTVRKPASVPSGAGGWWECECACGTTQVRRGADLRKGKASSCGCMCAAGVGTVRYNHPLRSLWSQMHARCTNVKHPNYHQYGGRGIRVCTRWDDFDMFVADVGPRPGSKSLDRINNDDGYCPANCRWATPKEQGRNTRQCIETIVDGQRFPAIAAAQEFMGVSKSTITAARRASRQSDTGVVKIKGHEVYFKQANIPAAKNDLSLKPE